jgi:hypothetical protein
MPQSGMWQNPVPALYRAAGWQRCPGYRSLLVTFGSADLCPLGLGPLALLVPEGVKRGWTSRWFVECCSAGVE